MSDAAICEFCSGVIPLNRTNCPHCARPQLFPNVRIAESNNERKKLHARYLKSQTDCRRRGCEDVFTELEQACSTSRAIFNCSTLKLFREVATGTELFESYYDLETLRIRSERPSPHDWQKLRPQSEIELLGGDQNRDQLHYAALSLNGVGLDGYGNCTVLLRDEMISHRASCFEGNSALIFENRHDFSDCLRSSWNDRAKLCAAKIAARINKSMSSVDFPSMLLTKGATQDADDFVEVHVFGTMTPRTFECVAVDRSKLPRQEKALWNAVKDKLAISGTGICES